MFNTLKGRLLIIAVGATWLSNSILFFFLSATDWQLLLFVLVFSSAFVIAIVHYFFAFIENKLLALESGLLNFRDNEFSNSLAIKGKDELSQLCHLYNEVAEKLRAEKQSIYQRELLLDKVIESSPIMMFLVDDDGYFVYSNSETRHFLNQGKRMEGEKLDALMKHWPEALCQAIMQHRDGLFVIEEPDNSETWHLSRGDFLLNNKKHQLFLLKHMTRELSRQEVAVWKKVIRVISHELNNSLAPISSVTHSGQLIAKKYQDQKLPLIFDTIKERIDHLNSFISGYAKFAKLPTPRLEANNLSAFIAQLKAQLSFVAPDNIPDEVVTFDPSQLEQVLINLIKNAQESGSALSEVALCIGLSSSQLTFEVKDRGTGMSEQVLTNALIPFYSTKQSGTGLGLALCREIIEAHDGNISLHNRIGGGLSVRIVLPRKS
ncbi:sensor histidine kinase [Thalassotalea sediminis]|uniref:sensor histidine kinase n=1 Tax=Thalassotalea sediminis TaxID=1759089 RepID=UPI0025732BFF|nr:ATP-binding protein [Thalassotalea sediminis]